MPKTKETKENLDDNLFGAFKFMDQPVPAATTKEAKEDKAKAAKEKKVESTGKTPAEIAEEKALAEALEAAEKAKAKKEPTVEEEELDEEGSEDEEPEEELEDENNLSIFARELAEKGLLDLEEGDKIESEDDLYKVYNKTIKKAVEADRTDRPEDAQRFLEFLDNGGNPQEFHKFYYGDGATFEEFTIETEEDQEYVVREGLALEGYTEAEIDDEVADLKDLSKLDKKAAIQLKKLQKVEKEQKKAFLDSQKEFAKKQDLERQAQWTEFKKGLFDKQEISGFKFNDKMKNDTWDYMTKVVDRKKNLTQYQIDSESNPDARYMFAYLLKNKWDVKSLEKQVTTKVVGKLASKLNNYTDGRNKVAKGASVREKTDGTNPFGAFKTILS